MWRASRLCLSCIVSLGALLAGCVPLKPAANSSSTVLFGVRVRGETSSDSPVIGLAVNIEDEEGATPRAFAFEPKARISATCTDFLVRLSLPAGRYRLRRLWGITRGGVVMPRFDAEFAEAFEVRAHTTVHLGNIEIGDVLSASTRPTLLLPGNSADPSTQPYKRRWDNARPVGGAASRDEAIATIQSDATPMSQFEHVAAVPLDESAAIGLPAKARVRFGSYLKDTYPRAFAVAESGSTGTAIGGSDVIQRALLACKHVQASGESCHLFAVDDTLVSSLRRSEGTAAQVQPETIAGQPETTTAENAQTVLQSQELRQPQLEDTADAPILVGPP